MKVINFMRYFTTSDFNDVLPGDKVCCYHNWGFAHPFIATVLSKDENGNFLLDTGKVFNSSGHQASLDLNDYNSLSITTDLSVAEIFKIKGY